MTSDARDSSLQALPENPFFIFKNKFRHYEHSASAKVLGVEFVAKCCRVVRAQRVDAGVEHRTWVDNYVVRLGDFFQALQAFTLVSGTAGRLPGSFSTNDWEAFAQHLTARIQSQPLAEKTRSKLRLSLGKLLTILHREGALSTRIELGELNERKHARVGQSRFTQRGWARLTQPSQADSPYRFRVQEHGREYDYTQFRDVGRFFVLHTTARLKEYFHTCAAGVAKHSHERWTSVLTFLQDNQANPGLQEFYRQLGAESFRRISADTWEAVLYRWREHLMADVRTGKASPATRHQNIGRLNIVWDVLAGEGLVPSVRVAGIKNAKSQHLRKPTATLAQLTDGPQLADDRVRRACEHIVAFFDETDQDEARDYLRSLARALSPDRVRNLSADEVIEQIHALNAARLDAIRRCAEAEFRQWHGHWCEGKLAFDRASFDGPTLVSLLDGAGLTDGEKRRNSHQLLTKAPEHQRLGNALRYIDTRYGGALAGINGRMHHLSRSFGGRAKLEAYLNPHEHATLALWVLLLVDTAANCEVARQTPWNCLKPTKHPGRMHLVMGRKNRAGGKLIEDEVEKPSTDGVLSLPDAVRAYQSMAARLHQRAEGAVSDLLLLHDVTGQPQALSEFTARSWFVEFLSRHDELRGLDARPSMIRPSVLMDLQHRSGGHVEPAQILADHSSPSTTKLHYTGRTPIKLRYALNIRDFQERFQSVIIVSVDGAPAKLGISQAQFDRLLSEAARTGLGVACLNPLAGVQPGTQPGKQCTRLDACWDCRMRWVVATVDNCADLILFEEHLRSTSESGTESAASKWQERWLPWLAFAQVALQKLREGENAAIYGQAVELATLRRTSYVGIPLC